MTERAHLSHYSGRRVLVLGASGFIGQAARKALITLGAQVVSVSRTPPADPGWLAHDLREPQIEHLLAEARPSVVLNFAGYGVRRGETDNDAAVRVNSRLPALIANALGDRPGEPWPGRALVHIGSGFEYGTRLDDLHESGPAQPQTLYARTKYDGTLALLACEAVQAGLAVAVARPFTVYGPGEPEHRLLPSLLKARRDKTQVPLTAGTQRRDFIYVGDVVEAVLRLAATPGPNPAHNEAPIFNVASGRLSSVREFVEIAAQVLGIANHRLAFGAIETTTQESDHKPVNIDRLSKELGWRPRCTIREGVEKTLAALADSDEI